MSCNGVIVLFSSYFFCSMSCNCASKNSFQLFPRNALPSTLETIYPVMDGCLVPSSTPDKETPIWNGTLYVLKLTDGTSQSISSKTYWVEPSLARLNCCPFTLFIICNSCINVLLLSNNQVLSLVSLSSSALHTHKVSVSCYRN